MRILCFISALLLFSVQAQANTWQSYASLLQHHVKPTTIDGVDLHGVDYVALRKDPAFQQALDALAGADLSRLTTTEETLAFYINAYNLLAIAVVAKHWPLTSIKDAGSLFWPVWKREAGVIAGKAVTLDEVEHEILRNLGEPRIHFAIVCASVSCPDLRREVYRAEILNQQLEQQTQSFLRNTEKGLKVEGDTLRLSKIFSWFSEDFNNDPKTFVQAYRPELVGKKEAGYLPYDWRLNQLSKQ